MRIGRLLSIQYLRGIAASMVVFFHARLQFAGFEAVFPSWVGSAGVDVFFVVSGFVMVYITANRERSISTFLLARAIRIVPVYWFYTAGAAALLVIAPSLFRANEFTLPHFLLSLLFLPHQTPGDPGTMYPVIKIAWTLNYEVMFYFIFAISMLVSLTFRTAVAAAVIVGGYVLLNTFWNAIPDVVGFYSSDRLLEFAIGMLIGQAYGTRYAYFSNAFIGAPLVIIGFLLMWILSGLGTGPSFLLSGLPAALVVVGALALEAICRKYPITFLVALGDASYSIYLAHLFIVAIIRAAWIRFDLPIEGSVSALGFVLICLFLSSSAGLISFRLIERPTLSALRLYFSKPELRSE
jgi:exopolysaccharide production protein ExoZ